LPVVLTGNCHSQQAVVAGLGTDHLRLVWLDWHGDFNTPETTETGYFDGYGLAMVVGDCWQTLCATVPASSRCAGIVSFSSASAMWRPANANAWRAVRSTGLTLGTSGASRGGLNIFKRSASACTSTSMSLLPPSAARIDLQRRLASRRTSSSSRSAPSRATASSRPSRFRPTTRRMTVTSQCARLR